MGAIMSINLKETFEQASWAFDQGMSHAELIEDHAFNYGMKDGAGEIGLIARANEQDSAGDIDSDGESKKKKERCLQDIIDRAMDSFFNDMDNWSAQDFQDFNTRFANKLREKAKEAYEAGDYALYATLSDRADEYLEQAQAIWDGPGTDGEKREANKELAKDQDPDTVILVAYEMDEENITPEGQAALDELVNLHNPAPEEVAAEATPMVFQNTLGFN